MEFDEQEELIIKALIKDPRMSDNKIGKLTKVPIRTVSRKRAKLEQEGKINYYVAATKKQTAKHIYLIKFRMGITIKKLTEDIKKEPKIRTSFTELIYESNFAEVNGHTAIMMIIEDENDNLISEHFNSIILPLMLKNHGQDSIVEITTFRMGSMIRMFHNYLPEINVKNGKLKKEWELDYIKL